ncbi:unnamed protein product [Arctogadus glacialis]
MAGLLTTVSHLVPLGLLHLWPRYSSKDGQAVTPSGDTDLLCTPLRSRSLPFLMDRVGLIRIHYMELVCTDTSLESYGEKAAMAREDWRAVLAWMNDTTEKLDIFPLSDSCPEAQTPTTPNTSSFNLW